MGLLVCLETTDTGNWRICVRVELDCLSSGMQSTLIGNVFWSEYSFEINVSFDSEFSERRSMQYLSQSLVQDLKTCF